LRTPPRRRPDAAARRHRALSLLQRLLRRARRGSDPEPGGSDPGRPTRRLSALVPALWLHLPAAEHPSVDSMDSEHRPSALLHRALPRRVRARRRLASRLVRPARARDPRTLLLLLRVASNAPHAGGGMRRLFDLLYGDRLWPLILKELRQIRRNRRLVISL